METRLQALKNTARLAGFLYFLWILTAIYGLIYVPSRTIVKGDVVATAKKIVEHEFVFRTGMLNSIISSVIFVFIALVLYQLFKDVNARDAKMLVALVIVQIPVVFFMEAFSMTSLLLLKGEILKTFEQTQREDLAILFLKINNYVRIILEMFWGLWLFPFGRLVYQSGFIPRILGVFLILNGIAYLIHCTAHLLFPDYQALIFKLATPIWTLGEISIMLWLLIWGVKKGYEITAR